VLGVYSLRVDWLAPSSISAVLQSICARAEWFMGSELPAFGKIDTCAVAATRRPLHLLFSATGNGRGGLSGQLALASAGGDEFTRAHFIEYEEDAFTV
jgi:hypothetical protein